MLPTKFQVNWSFGSGEEAKNKFSKWRQWQPSWISYWNVLAIFFLSTNHPDAFYRFSSQLAFQFRKRSEQTDFQNGRHSGYLRFPIGTILAILIIKSSRCYEFKVNCLSVQEKKPKLDYQDGRHGGHLRFSIGTILPTFDLRVP